MSQRYAILCPGQGAQHAGMFDLVRHDSRGAAILQAYDLERRLGGDTALTLAQVLQDDALLFANRHAQALIVAAGMAAWDSMRDALPAPTLVAGYSVGELTAVGVAGMWSADTAIEAALVRARCMDACLLDVAQQGLMAVGGMALAAASALLNGYQVHVAIETGFDTLIAGGRRDDLLRAQTAMMAAGAHTTMLPVGIASHTPLMAAAVTPFAALLDSLSWHQAQCPLLAGVSGLAVADQPAARNALLAQLTATIHWSACMDACVEQGINVALELGPGSALSRMLRERHAHIECRSLADFRTLAGALKWLANHLD